MEYVVLLDERVLVFLLYNVMVLDIYVWLV